MSKITNIAKNVRDDKIQAYGMLSVIVQCGCIIF